MEGLDMDGAKWVGQAFTLKLASPQTINHAWKRRENSENPKITQKNFISRHLKPKRGITLLYRKIKT